MDKQYPLTAAIFVSAAFHAVALGLIVFVSTLEPSYHTKPIQLPKINWINAGPPPSSGGPGSGASNISAKETPRTTTPAPQTTRVPYKTIAVTPKATKTPAKTIAVTPKTTKPSEVTKTPASTPAKKTPTPSPTPKPTWTPPIRADERGITPIQKKQTDTTAPAGAKQTNAIAPPPMGRTIASAGSPDASGIPGSQPGASPGTGSSTGGSGTGGPYLISPDLPSYYTDQARERIRSFFTYPPRYESLDVTCQVAFDVDRDGRISSIVVIQGTGSPVLDRYAVKALTDTVEIAPLPETVTKPKLTLVVTFSFKK